MNINLLISSCVSSSNESLMRWSDTDENQLLDSGNALLNGNTTDARYQVLQRNSFLIVGLKETKIN